MPNIHASPYGGSWYPGERGELERLLEVLFANSAQRVGPALLPGAAGFIAPHAGLFYSGTVAAAVFRHAAACKPRRIVLLSFSHRGGPPEVCIPDVDGFATVLGDVMVDRETADQLPFRCVPESSVCDHSLEIQLPLLQHALPGTPIVPLYVGGMSDKLRHASADTLAEIAGSDTVFIASSDLTHYGPGFYYTPFPVDADTRYRLHDLDHSIMEACGTLDSAYFLKHVAKLGATACGTGPISLLLGTLARLDGPELFQEILDYQTSGEITGDFEHSVSYGAMGFFPASSFALSRAEQELLLLSARSTLEHYLATGKRRPVLAVDPTPMLRRKVGAFVSLHEKTPRGPRLRGCVGNFLPVHELFVAVPDLTLAAALDDPRFPALQAPEHPIEIEVSVLSPAKRISSPEQFRLGEHGCVIECGSRKSLLLPQVGQGPQWTGKKFLEALCAKAGLPSGAYRDPEAVLYVFRAQVFE